MVSPVAGLMVGKVLPDAASVHLLLMSSLLALTFTVGSMAVEAVAIQIPPKARQSSRREHAAKNLCSRNPGRTGQPFSSAAGSVTPNFRAVLPASRKPEKRTPVKGEKQGREGRHGGGVALNWTPGPAPFLKLLGKSRIRAARTRKTGYRPVSAILERTS